MRDAGDESGQRDAGRDHEFDATRVAALLFDLGGVVIGLDFDRIFRAWAATANCDYVELRARFREDEAYEQHERGELDADGYFASLRDTLGIELSDADFLLGWNDLYLDPIAGMTPLLRSASSCLPTFAFTNSNPSHQAVWSKRFRHELAVFETVFSSSELGVRKPDPHAFSVVAALAGHRPSEFLFFDDTEANAVGAKGAGMQAVHVRSVHDVRTALARLGIHAD
jgi:putative hydrolase of the HAD superfamily